MKKSFLLLLISFTISLPLQAWPFTEDNKPIKTRSPKLDCATLRSKQMISYGPILYGNSNREVIEELDKYAIMTHNGGQDIIDVVDAYMPILVHLGYSNSEIKERREWNTGGDRSNQADFYISQKLGFNNSLLPLVDEVKVFCEDLGIIEIR